MEVSVLCNGILRTLVTGLFGQKMIFFPDVKKKVLGSGHFSQVGSGNPKHTYFLFGLGIAYFILSSLGKT